ncbi:hypothetical protein ACQ86N_44425 [Puia sp. P3]|uniref:hypothetical protein n=1 Tax=Puia sp. P3 TaxID=3423952 RepID=UPI003D66DA41
MVSKAKIFVVDAGKVIMVISLILWFLSSLGPGKSMETAKTRYDLEIKQHPDQAAELERSRQAAILESSYAGHLGKIVEPVIRPWDMTGRSGSPSSLPSPPAKSS